ncbi:Hint domain-containing protein [Palleronia caenipelagi]|uniref:Hint domain-containing protein n=2 Tax=Palleronia caenipelagi TaxID=2489174 RepID=A0A547PH15_9RHOB|nr:Hint domain-containing protein [Palleronia caenipelagi]
MMRADHADGTLNGIIGGIDYTAQIGDISLAIQNGGAAVADTELTFDTTNVTGVVCFTRGTRITTDRGDVAIEDLDVGDLVLTQDRGLQPIRWIGSNGLDRETLAAHDRLRPILIRAGALGQGMPERDLRVSPQHRVLVRSKIAIRMFDAEEVLIPANKLLALDGIDIDAGAQSVEYYHMLFDQHEIVFSNGAPTESLFTGPEALKAVSPAAREEIRCLFPEICGADYQPIPVRPIPEKGKLMKRLVYRHRSNGKPMLE